jgi:tetratricopeptide (TPR) repeat protein
VNLWLSLSAALAVVVVISTAVSGQTLDQTSRKRIKSDTNKSLQEGPKDYTFYIRRGLGYWAIQDTDKATDAFQKSIKLNPYKPSPEPLSELQRFQKLELARAYYNLGSIDCFKKQYKTAIPYFTKTIELAPNFPQAYKNRGLAYRQLDQKEAAVKDLKKAEQLFISPDRVLWPPADARGPVSSHSKPNVQAPISRHTQTSI